MLRMISSLRGIDLHATDGHLGKVQDLFFEDRDWTVLYMSVDTAQWLPGRRVLVPPATFGEADWVERTINVMVTREEIETSPEIHLHESITREQEVAYFAHFGWACLWNGELRGVDEIIGSSLVGQDEKPVGVVSDLVVDEVWIIRYVVVAVGDGLEERLTLIPVRLLANKWGSGGHSVLADSESLASAPQFDPRSAIQRDHEEDLHRHYSAPSYWE